MASADGTSSEHKYSWNASADKYDDVVGHSSSLSADTLISLAHSIFPLDSNNLKVIDLGAGTGSLTHSIAARYPDTPILATDISQQMLDKLNQSTARKSASKITTQILDMRKPVTNSTPECSFTHIFSSCALQALTDPLSAIKQWTRLLRFGGTLAISIWIHDPPCGPYRVWKEAVNEVDKGYQPIPPIEDRQWSRLEQLEQGMRDAGIELLKSKVVQVGFNTETEEFMSWFFESNNPGPMDWMRSFDGDLDAVKSAMRRRLKENYDDGRHIPLEIGCVVGRK